MGSSLRTPRALVRIRNLYYGFFPSRNGVLFCHRRLPRNARPRRCGVSLAVIFGANLRHHRKGRHLTQAALAEMAGLSTEMISKMERGAAAPSFATIEVLSEILDLPAGMFFGVGTATALEGERTRLLGKIHTRLSRLNEDQLVRADRMLGALAD